MNSPASEPQLLLSWKAHPARERPGAAVGAGFLILALAAAVLVFSASWIWAVVALLVLLLSLSRFFLPSRFDIGEEGITARYPLRRQRMLWRNLRRFAQDQRGGYLSTRAVPSRMDAYSGMHILFGQSRAQATQEIRRHLPRREPAAANAVKELAA